jgi:hypothetical protein
MLKQKKFIVAFFGSMLVFGVALTAYVQMQETPEVKLEAKKSMAKTRQPRKTHKGRRNLQTAANQETAEKIEPQKRVGINFSFDEAEEAKLTEEQKKLLAELRAALDDESLKKVCQIASKIQAMGLDSVPEFLQKEVIDALGWFDSKTMPELFGFLGSPSEEVRESAADELLSALDDDSLSDSEIASVIVNVSKVLRDEDMLEDAFSYFVSLRNSVGVNTFKQIMASGTDVAKNMLADAIEEFTDGNGSMTAQQLDDWLKANPDGEDDDNFYGGDKDGDGDYGFDDADDADEE